MSVLKTLSFVVNHPLNQRAPLAALGRVIGWQVKSRFQNDVEFDWIEGTRLIVSRGMTGATGNIYCGLHEFCDMAFALHLLTPDDLFVDVGANIGSYTILASGVVGARTIAIEPDPVTMSRLRRNVEANALGSRVQTLELAVGQARTQALFTVGRDTTNKFASPEDADVRTVEVDTLDHILQAESPTLIKLDVEGFEAAVFAGARDVLKSERLLAVETETKDEFVLSVLNDAGFEEYFYNPFRRMVENRRSVPANNSLFVRDVEVCNQRVRQSRKFLVNGDLV